MVDYSYKHIYVYSFLFYMISNRWSKRHHHMASDGTMHFLFWSLSTHGMLLQPVSACSLHNLMRPILLNLHALTDKTGGLNPSTVWQCQSKSQHATLKHFPSSNKTFFQTEYFRHSSKMFIHSWCIMVPDMPSHQESPRHICENMWNNSLATEACFQMPQPSSLVSGPALHGSVQRTFENNFICRTCRKGSKTSFTVFVKPVLQGPCFVCASLAEGFPA